MVSRTAVSVVAFVFAVSLHADSVTTQDGVSLNGRLVTLDGRGAVVRARFEDGERQMLVPREALVGIEFNARMSNAAGLSGLVPAALAAKRQAVSANQIEDVVVLSTGERRSCPPVEIDGQRLRCGPEVIALGTITSLTVGRVR